MFKRTAASWSVSGSNVVLKRFMWRLGCPSPAVVGLRGRRRGLFKAMLIQGLSKTCRFQNPGIPRAGRVGAAHGGAAGRGEAEQDGTPTGRFAQETTDLCAFLDSRASRTTVLNVSSQARTQETYVNRWRNKTSG